ncbi:MAG TPA: carboxypeptidase regulatory-like domain-containing protein [Acidimicrobiales bacterium]|nr:carboxypeptidase regulatory-like domain-containing protein [Acidimicrobiales bacterium]
MGLGSPAAPPAEAQVAATAVPREEPDRGLVYAGLEPTGTRAAAGRGPVKPTCTFRTIQTNLCTHGPDAAPAGVPVDAPPPERSAAAAPGIECSGDGASGLRTLVVYARASDVPDRYDAYVDRIRAWAATADAIYQDSAAETGGTRRVRFVHDGQCAMRVAHAVLPPTADDSFDAMVVAMRAAGMDRTDRKYLVFADATVYCGIASLSGDDRPGATNASNAGPSYARVDRACWGGATAVHEHAHNLGAVQDSAPHASRGGHCTDEWDVMCYSDEPLHPTMQVLCPDTLRDSTRLDCRHDDYFSTSPAQGSYLATHWNTADNAFLSHGGPTGSLRGQVLGADGAPAAGARVRLLGTTIPPATSDETGAYAFEALAHGTYRLQADDGCSVGELAVTVVGDLVRHVGFSSARRDPGGYSCARGVADPGPTGTVLPLTGDDVSLAVPLPFAFPFYGASYRTVTVSTNGSLNVTGDDTPPTNVPIPDEAPPDGAVHALWDDLVVDERSSVRTGPVGTAPDRRFVVEWRDVAFYGEPEVRLSVQAVLFEDGDVEVSYRDVGPSDLERGAGATIGLEAPDGRSGFAFSTDVPVLRDGLAVRWSQLPGSPPSASAGPDLVVGSGAPVRLDAGRSTDPDGGPLTYRWTQTAGPAAVLQDRDGVATVVSGVRGPATLRFTVRVTDPTGRDDTDEVVVTVRAPK